MQVDREETNKDSDSVRRENTSDDSECDNSSFCKENTPKLMNHSKLNDRVRDLYLSKQLAEVHASRLKENHVLEN